MTVSFWIQRLNRLLRLSASVSSGAFPAGVGNCRLLPRTIPVTIPAKVFRCRAKLPCGSPGYRCLRPVLWHDIHDGCHSRIAPFL